LLRYIAYWSADPSRESAAAVIRRVRHTFLRARAGGVSNASAREGLVAERVWRGLYSCGFNSCGFNP
jgi:hypothetical protein